MNKFNQLMGQQNSALRAIVSILIGMILVFMPELSITLVVSVVGAVILVLGLIGVIGYFQRRKPAEGPVLLPFGAIVSCILGIVMLVAPKAFTNVMMILLGVLLLIGAIAQLMVAVTFYKNAAAPSFAVFIYPLIILICSIVIMANPFGSSVGLLMFFGISIIIYGIIELISYFKFRRLDQHDPTQV